MHDSQQTKHRKPQHHNRSEKHSDKGRAVFLNQKQCSQNDDSNWHDERGERRRDDL